MKSYIDGHNKNLIGHDNKNTLECNCTRSVCPLPLEKNPPNNCRQNDIIYQGEIKKNETESIKTYKGCTSDQFKNRVSVHRNTFNDTNKKNNTEMAKAVHALVESGHSYTIKWKIIDKTSSYRPGDKFCKLCNLEKYHILFKKEETDVNTFRLEKCRHKRKQHLGAIT